MTWAGTRRAQLPRDWEKRRQVVKARAGGQCQSVDQGQRCIAPGTDCDHINRLAGDDLLNLQWLCRAHHGAKTRAEARTAKSSRRRAPEAHPGLLA